jgi:hypothetical protein
MRLHDKIRHILDTTPGLTQRGLAECMGLNPAAVNRMLYGRRNIMAEEIPIIEGYLGQNLNIHADAEYIQPERKTPPRGLSDIPQARLGGGFAVYVFADDMAPRYFKGELVMVDRQQQAEEDRDCLIEKKNGTVLIRRLLKRGAEKIRVRQYAPLADKDILMKDIRAIYPVIGRG